MRCDEVGYVVVVVAPKHQVEVGQLGRQLAVVGLAHVG